MKCKITEGYMPFLQYKTYYRIVGEPSDKAPLVLLHGGPGSTHNYFEVLDELADDGRQLIMYDQLGCGNSYVEGHPELWKKETWIAELEALRSYLKIESFHLLGQSWGGMLAISYAIDKKPDGLKSLILSSTLPSSKLWADEQHRMIRYLPIDEQQAIAAAEKTGDFSSDAYLKANAHYMEEHCGGPFGPDDPECLRRKKKSGDESYLYAWGPNEYNPTGTLADFDYTDRLNEIHVPAMVFSGTDDLCTPLIAKTMYDAIPESSWVLFPYSRHMCYVDAHDAYVSELAKWLNAHD